MPTLGLTPGRGLAVMLAGILGILYAPFYALAYFATEDGASSRTGTVPTAWADALEPVLEPFLTFASPNAVYLTYGKAFTFVALGYMLGLLMLHRLQAPHSGRLEKWGFRLAFTGVTLAFTGSIGVYWVGSIWWGVIDYFFLIFMVPALLFFGFGFLLFGIGTLRAKVAPRLGAWLLIAGGLPGIVLLSVLFGQLTMGLLILNAAWTVLGYWLYSEAAEPARSAPRMA